MIVHVGGKRRPASAGLGVRVALALVLWWPGAAAAFLVRGTTYSDAPGTGFGTSVAGVGVEPFASGESVPPSPVGRVALAVGAPLEEGGGRVHVFRDPYGPSPGDRVLASPSPVAAGRFGAAVAGARVDRVLAGAPGERDGMGAVYAFPAFGEADAMVVPTPPLAPGAEFGAALDADLAGRVLVGAPATGSPGDPGSAYLISPTGAVVELRRPAPSPGALFGAAVALVQPSTAADVAACVGAPFEGGSGFESGAVHLFDGAGDLVATIGNPRATSSGGGVLDGFGAALAVRGTVLAVGAPLATVRGVTGAGLVHLFDVDVTSPGFGTVLRTIERPDLQADAAFGAALAFVDTVVLTGGDILPSEPALLVGAPFDDVDALDGGAVYQVGADPSLSTFGEVVRRLPYPGAVNFGRVGTALAGVGSDGAVAAGAPGGDISGQVTVYANCGNALRGGEQCDSPTGCVQLPDAAACTAAPPDCGGGDGALAVQVVSPGEFRVFCDCSQAPGDACDDAIACTTGDRCDGPGGACRGTPDDAQCPADANACSTARCDVAAGGCVQDLRECPDDGDPCTVDACDPASGECTRTQKPGCRCRNDAECDDGDPANGLEVCSVCTGCGLIRRACCAAERQCCVQVPPTGGVNTCNQPATTTTTTTITAPTTTTTTMLPGDGCGGGTAGALCVCRSTPALPGCTLPRGLRGIERVCGRLARAAELRDRERVARAQRLVRKAIRTLSRLALRAERRLDPLCAAQVAGTLRDVAVRAGDDLVRR